MEAGRRRRSTQNPATISTRASNAKVGGESVGIVAVPTTTVLELLTRFGSGLAPATVAVFATVVFVRIVTLSVIVAEAPTASVPTAQVTVEPLVQLPCELATEVRVVPTGRMSVTITPWARAGPLLVTTIVKVTLPATSALAVLAMLRSAAPGDTVAAVLELLFDGTGSVVVEVTVAVLVIVPVVPADTFTTIENVADAPAGSVAIVQVIVPVPPAAGVVHAKVGPVVWLSETNVVPDGMVSESDTLAASPGPPFATVIEYEALTAEATTLGPVLVTLTSAPAVTGADVVAELFAEVGSLVAAVTVAVFAIVPDAPAATFTTMLNVAEAPAGSVAIAHVIVPVPPGTGVAHPKAGPVVWVSETNVVPAGSGSDSDTLAASEGPAFATTTV